MTSQLTLIRGKLFIQSWSDTVEPLIGTVHIIIEQMYWMFSSISTFGAPKLVHYSEVISIVSLYIGGSTVINDVITYLPTPGMGDLDIFTSIWRGLLFPLEPSIPSKERLL